METSTAQLQKTTLKGWQNSIGLQGARLQRLHSYHHKNLKPGINNRMISALTNWKVCEIKGCENGFV
jgi:hypothetical protein